MHPANTVQTYGQFVAAGVLETCGSVEILFQITMHGKKGGKEEWIWLAAEKNRVFVCEILSLCEFGCWLGRKRLPRRFCFRRKQFQHALVWHQTGEEAFLGHMCVHSILVQEDET
jgi:hypothetical protein